jgi:hypothetical protein
MDKTRNLQKKIPKWRRTNSVYLRVSPFGASGGTSGAPDSFLLENVPKVVQKWSQDCNSAPKNDPKMVKVNPKYREF